jgi:hypothetical protein
MRTIEQWREIVNEAKSDRALAKFVLGDLTHYQNGRAHEGDDLVSLSNLFACLFEDSTRQTHWTFRAEVS